MPNVDVLGPTQQAFYDTLTGDTALTAKITGVFDEVPEGTQFPYVTLGDQVLVSAGAGAHDAYGGVNDVTLHVWSDHHGFTQANDIVDDIMRLFDHQPLAIAGHRTVSVRHAQTVAMRDPDQDLRHVAVRFVVETEHDAP